jgi:hypothetical protein
MFFWLIKSMGKFELSEKRKGIFLTALSMKFIIFIVYGSLLEIYY